MSEFGDWLSSNWYEAGTLLLHAALLVTVIWYVRKSVKIKIASLQQSDSVQLERVTLTAAPGLSLPEHGESRRRRVISPWQVILKAVRWLQAPIGG
jgi:hypothetical protein